MMNPVKTAKLRLLIPAVFVAGTAAWAQDVALETEQQQLSYMLGMEVARSLGRIGVDIDVKVFSQAIQTVLDGGEPLLSPEQVSQLQASLMQRMQQQQQQQQQQAQTSANGAENQAAGEAYMTENAAREGVQTTDSGLQYEVLEQGDGPKPDATDQVTVHYRGTLIDGTEFDSSYGRNQPATFPLDGVIPGWTEGLQLMSVGSKYRFVIPPQLAYGERGAGGRIGPNSTLVFEVELLEVK